MTLLEVLPHSRQGIRRASWVHGHRIQWSDGLTQWRFMNEFEVVLGQHRPVDLFYSQGLLTPESMAAQDWEIAT